MDTEISKIVEKLSGSALPGYKMYMEIEVCGEVVDSEVDATMPTFKYKFRWKWFYYYNKLFYF